MAGCLAAGYALKTVAGLTGTLHSEQTGVRAAIRRQPINAAVFPQYFKNAEGRQAGVVGGLWAVGDGCGLWALADNGSWEVILP